MVPIDAASLVEPMPPTSTAILRSDGAATSISDPVHDLCIERRDIE